MIAQLAPPPVQTGHHPTLWGLTPAQLHDRFWAARGVQVVRQGERSEIVGGAELFLLTDARTLAIFRLARPVEVLSWIKPDVLLVRLRDQRERGYREHAITDEDGRFVRFIRDYGGADARLARVALTPDRRIAQLWQNAPDTPTAWRLLRQEVERQHRSVLSLAGSVYDRGSDAEVTQFMRHLTGIWEHPSATIPRAQSLEPGLWADGTVKVADEKTIIGPVWVGAGRTVEPGATIVGPTVLWDDPAARPEVDDLEWQDIEPSPNFARRVVPSSRTTFSQHTKRGFDILFALAALAFTLPLYPFIMLAIWLEDGGPFFFAHPRESRGGKEFGCIKFRSMRKDADLIKAQLAKANQSDGPQFFMEDDPRITRVGRVLRKTNLDELPQFINVLLGQMSVVGPRPSPFKENQYSPGWREARLSVRPGVTGLWQVRRTRRAGLDFQEWIKYDIEYVERQSWWLDIRIIIETVVMIVRGILRA